MTSRLRHVATAYAGDHGISPRDVDHWTTRAACRDHGALFDAAYNHEPRKRGVATKPSPEVVEAKAVCGRCPVFADCLTEVLAHPTHYGIWAGMDADERTNYARKVRRLP